MDFTMTAEPRPEGSTETSFRRPAGPVGQRVRIDGTAQQEEFWNELLTGAGNVMLEARAGTGKSTSCREGMFRMLDHFPSTSIRYCCFNKKIAEEFAEKAPQAANVGTMHSFGNELLKSAHNSQLDRLKTYAILDTIGSDAKGAKRYHRKAVEKIVGLAKNHSFRPGDVDDLMDLLGDLVERFDVETYGRLDDILEWSAHVLNRSADTLGIIDFDDMLWLPVVHGLTFPGVDMLFIDEAQDLNPVQIELASLMSGSGRTVAVGDPFQSIYAFRGADSEAIPRLISALDAKVMPLTITFRCPRLHVLMARHLVPDFECALDAPDGVVLNGGQDAILDADPGSMVLCRANGPLIEGCLKMIGRGQSATVRGRDIGRSLVMAHEKVLRHRGPVTIQLYSRSVDSWMGREIMRLEGRDGTDHLIEQVMDQAKALEAVAGACDSVTAIPGRIEALFSDDTRDGQVTFSSVHRAKGSEAREVYYLNVPYRQPKPGDKPIPQWERQQRRNLQYVAITRSLHSLTLCS